MQSSPRRTPSCRPTPKARTSLRRATGPVVLIGEDSFGEELAEFGAIGSHRFKRSERRGARQGRAAERPEKRRHERRRPLHGLGPHGQGLDLARKDACPVWVRCVNEFGNDVVKEIFRNGKRRKRCLYEVAACAPYSAVLSVEERAAWGGGAASIKRIVDFHRRERLSDEEVALEAGLDTFFVSLTFEDYELAETRRVLGCRRGVETELQPDAVVGRPRASRESSFAPSRPDAVDPRRELANDARVTALEFRCDLLRSYNPGNVLKQLHAAREACQASWRGTEAKLMFTVRSVSQAGAFRDEDVDEMASLLELGLRAGVDWLDVETETLSRKQLKRLRRMADARGATLILGSHHQLGETTSSARAEALLNKCAKRSDGDAVKLVVDAASADDAASAATVADVEARPPRVVLALGDAGKLSRVLGRRFLPATTMNPYRRRQLLGQISPNEALALRRDWGVVSPKKYAVLLESDFGSRSPAMHNAAFRACGLPHQYSVLELPDEGRSR